MSAAFFNFYLIRWKLGKVDEATINSLVPAKLTADEAAEIIATPKTV